MNGMTKSMSEAYEELLAMVENAGGSTFGKWFAGSDEDYEDWLISRTSQIGERRVRQQVKRARERYELAGEGVVGAGSINLNTLKALEHRGLIEFVEVYGLYGTAVKVVF